MKDASKMLDTLRDLYFDKLEEQGIEYLEWDEADQGYSFSHVKDEFLDATVEEMVKVVWGDSWQGQWAKMNLGA